MGIGLHAKSPYETNYYNILKEYDIQPPMLKYGYPLWYQYDSLPITGIIYLKDDLTDLHKINDITYVAEPTKENAEIILNFSGEVGLYPKFYIVPDSALEWRKVIEFLEFLVPDYGESRILLCGGSGCFINYIVKDESYRYGTSMGCNRYSNLLAINYNCLGQVRFEGEDANPDSVAILVARHYLRDYGKPDSYRGIERRIKNEEDCLMELKDWSSVDPRDSTHQIFLNQIINEIKQELKLVQKWSQLFLPLKNNMVLLRIQNCYRNTNSVYRIFDQINRGVYLSREKRASEFSKKSYANMFLFKKVDELEYIHLEFPDLVEHRFLRFPEPLPVPF